MSVATQLEALGWRMNTPPRFTRAVENFQRGWCLGVPLVIDGIPGPKTQAALKKSHTNLISGRGTASPHFSFSEFTCKCGGKYSDCERIHMLAAHINRLEVYRSKVGVPVAIVSGYRCPAHNKAVGGATNSQHMYGSATDILGLRNSSWVRTLQLFAGIGYRASNGTVVHVDSRDISGVNLTNSTRVHPALWQYAT